VERPEDSQTLPTQSDGALEDLTVQRDFPRRLEAVTVAKGGLLQSPELRV